MNPKILIGIGIVVLLIVGNAARTEYSRIQARIETTQAKIDKLADETGAMVDILSASIEDVRKAVKAITERFTKQGQASFEVIEHKASEPIKKFDPPTQPRIVMHSADEENGIICGPCRAWLRTEKSKWEQIGWSIEVAKEIETKRGWPWYEIYDRDGKRFEVDGALTNEKFLAAKRKAE